MFEPIERFNFEPYEGGPDFDVNGEYVRYEDHIAEIERALSTHKPALAMKVRDDAECICKGNWRLIVKETSKLIGRKYMCVHSGELWTFFGVVDGFDDYYYGMRSVDDLRLLSCAGSIEGFGFELQPGTGLYEDCEARHDAVAAESLASSTQDGADGEGRK